MPIISSTQEKKDTEIKGAIEESHSRIEASLRSEIISSRDEIEKRLLVASRQIRKKARKIGLVSSAGLVGSALIFFFVDNNLGIFSGIFSIGVASIADLIVDSSPE